MSIVPTPCTFAVIGGSGFYEMPGLTDVEEIRIDTPFGPPSDVIRVGRLGEAHVAFLARHGRGHTLLPSELPQQANFWALKALGVTRVLAVSAVGSLREQVRPGDLVIPDQLIDRTRGQRASTFFGNGIVAHVSFADPFCPRMRAAALAATRATGTTVHDGGTYVVIEGPSFGTRAESQLYRSWGAAVVGMTALPEAKLARESEICYATVSAVTDYDCWHESEDAVTAETVFSVLRRDVEATQEAIRRLAADLVSTPPDGCECETTLDSALVTPPEAISQANNSRLRPILARRLTAGR